jgi:hypothetical protein
MIKIVNSDKWAQLEKTKGITAITFASVVEADSRILDWSKTASLENLIKKTRKMTQEK